MNNINKTKRLLGCLAALALLGAGHEAQAVLDIDVGDTMTISGGISEFYDSGTVNINGQNRSALVGAFALNVTVEPASAGNSGSIYSFCTDLLNNWQYSNTYKALPFDGEDGLNPLWSATPESMQNAGWLYQEYLPHMLNSGFSYTPEEQKSIGAAMQLAIWEVLYDTDPAGNASSTFDLNSGAFTTVSGFEADTLAFANTYLTALKNTGDDLTAYDSTWLSPIKDDQGLIYYQDLDYDPPDIIPVPEVTTLFAGALVLIPFSASLVRTFRRRRQ